jgi:hypothetical protein
MVGGHDGRGGGGERRRRGRGLFVDVLSSWIHDGLREIVGIVEKGMPALRRHGAGLHEQCRLWEWHNGVVSSRCHVGRLGEVVMELEKCLQLHIIYGYEVCLWPRNTTRVRVSHDGRKPLQLARQHHT